MTDDLTLDDALARAKAILARGDSTAVGGGYPVIWDDDRFDAHLLLARFVAEIERLRADYTEAVRLYRERDAQAARYYDRLQIDPGGSDRIDELEAAIEHLRADRARLHAAGTPIDIDAAVLWIQHLIAKCERADVLATEAEERHAGIERLRTADDAAAAACERADAVLGDRDRGIGAGGAVDALIAEIERLRDALDDIATADPTMDDARALVSVAKVALRGGRCEHLYEEGGTMCLRCGAVRKVGT